MRKYIETENIELKEKLSENICKEIVAFLNTAGGTIYLGVCDDGEVVGVENVDEVFKKISDIVYSQIEPSPVDFVELNVKFECGVQVVAVNVKKGEAQLYCQKKYGFSTKGCSVRFGTTTREMTHEQITKRQQEQSYVQDLIIKKESNKTNLTFQILKICLSEKGYHIENNVFEENFSLLNKENRYNIMAELLSDKNERSIVFVKFRGKSKADVSEVIDYGKTSIIRQYYNILNRIKVENICISNTKERPRVDEYLFDFDAVEEAIINAVIHNDWSVGEPQISLFSDRMEILSHGGLVRGLSEEDFYLGRSKLRNAALMRIFMSLGISEHTGHGVPTIIEKYGREVFEISENFLLCTIPYNKKVIVDNYEYFKEVIDSNRSKDEKTNAKNKITSLENKVVNALVKSPKMTALEVAQANNLSIRTVERTVASLRDKGYIERQGSKRFGFWKVLEDNFMS